MGLEAQRDAKAKEIELVAKERADLEGLAQKKLVERARLTALDRDIAGLPPLGAELAGAGVGAEGAAPASGAVYPGRAATANANATLNMDNAAGFALGVLVGGLVALAGVALGARIGRRR